MDQRVQEERRNSGRLAQRESDERKGKIVGAVLAVIAIAVFTIVFTPVDIAMISGILVAGIVIFFVGAVTAAMTIFPKSSQALFTLGLILIGASLVLFVLATIVLHFDNSRFVTP